MKNQYYVLLVCTVMMGLSVFGQYRLNPDYPPVEIHDPTCIYTVKPGTAGINLERRQEIAEKMLRNETPCSTFDVNYVGFSPEAEAAFQFAVDIWAQSIESTRTITVSARFEPAANPNNLGSAAPTAAYALEVSPGGPTYWYPAALAEKLTDSDLFEGPNPPPFGETVDIIANFNSNRTDWYFGTDANPPANQIDFVTVVLHELGHGLGFTGLFSKVNNSTTPPTGRVRVNGLAPIYDVFIENGNGDEILSFPDPSTDLLVQFESNDLFNFSAEAINGNNAIKPKIYTPDPFVGGRSYSHWDEATFPSGNSNALMTPFASSGVATHDPGPSTLGFFEDMGWSLCNSLSINEFDADVVVMSPNPFSETLTISFQDAMNGDYTIEILDINGKLVTTRQVNISGRYTLDNLGDLKDALYFIKLTNVESGASMTEKIIKN